jgi:hypothetical protein
MQRVRVGLTGLAAIFLLVMIAAAGVRPTAHVVPPKGQGETLAMLGVAPSSGTESQAAPAAHQSTPRPAAH